MNIYLLLISRLIVVLLPTIVLLCCLSFTLSTCFSVSPNHRSPRRNRPKSANRGSSRSQRYRRSTVASACRCRSASPDRLVGRMSRLGLDDEFEYYDDEPKPPFVVRHVSMSESVSASHGLLFNLTRQPCIDITKQYRPRPPPPPSLS